MFANQQNNEALLPCPRCKLKTAHQINFGKKGHCWNCQYVWDLHWKGGHGFSTQMRLDNV